MNGGARSLLMLLVYAPVAVPRSLPFIYWVLLLVMVYGIGLDLRAALESWWRSRE